MRLASFPRLPRTPALRWGLALAALLMTIGVAGRDVVPAWMAIQGRALISDFRHFDAMPMAVSYTHLDVYKRQLQRRDAHRAAGAVDKLDLRRQ